MQRFRVLLAAMLVPGLAGASATVVTSADPDAGRPVEDMSSAFAYVDEDGDAVAGPLEGFYLDVHGDRRVSAGDIRLVPFGDFAAWSSVASWDYDAGSYLDAVRGGVASADGAVVLDTDANGLVSPGDVRLTGPSGGRTVKAGDPDLGARLTGSSSAGPPRVGRLGDAWEPGKPLFLDLDGNALVSPLDVRIQPGGAGPEPVLATDLADVVKNLTDRIAALEQRAASAGERAAGLEREVAALREENEELRDRVRDRAAPGANVLVAVAAAIALAAAWRRRP